MQVTYFIRNNDNEYNEFCSKASIKLKKGTKIYYGGVQIGEHNPSDVVDFIVADLEQLNFYDWLSSLGYSVVQEPIT